MRAARACAARAARLFSHIQPIVSLLSGAFVKKEVIVPHVWCALK